MARARCPFISWMRWSSRQGSRLILSGAKNTRLWSWMRSFCSHLLSSWKRWIDSKIGETIQACMKWSTWLRRGTAEVEKWKIRWHMCQIISTIWTSILKKGLTTQLHAIFNQMSMMSRPNKPEESDKAASPPQGQWSGIFSKWARSWDTPSSSSDSSRPNSADSRGLRHRTKWSEGTRKRCWWQVPPAYHATVRPRRRSSLSFILQMIWHRVCRWVDRKSGKERNQSTCTVSKHTIGMCQTQALMKANMEVHIRRRSGLYLSTGRCIRIKSIGIKGIGILIGAAKLQFLEAVEITSWIRLRRFWLSALKTCWVWRRRTIMDNR